MLWLNLYVRYFVQFRNVIYQEPDFCGESDEAALSVEYRMIIYANEMRKVISRKKNIFFS